MEGYASGARVARFARASVFASVACTLLVAAQMPEREGGRPGDPEEVVARVPARSSAAQARIAGLAMAVARAPERADRAVALARAHVELARADGDPRHLGEAEAALACWIAAPDAPAEVRVLEATLLQARHAFPAALRALDRALSLRPDDPQALLTRAAVLTVLGQHRAARASCDRLQGRASPSIVASCGAPLMAIEGRYDEARVVLDSALAREPGRDERALLLSLRGEQAFWHGDTREAEDALRAALALAPEDRYTRALYADLLLDAQRADEVAALVRPYPADDALALRGVLAAVALGAGDAQARVAQLARGFEESRLRGDAVHQREEARLWLARPGAEPARTALTRALESWAVQREPWDARVVLEAALRAGRPEAAAPVRTWLVQTHFAAPRLQMLSDRLQTVAREP